MLVRDIRPPLQRAIEDTAKAAENLYRTVRILIKTSKYGVVVFLIVSAAASVSIVTAISGKIRQVDMLPSYVTNDFSSKDTDWWNNIENIRSLDLGANANLSEFSGENSAFTIQPTWTNVVDDTASTTASVFQKLLVAAVGDKASAQEVPASGAQTETTLPNVDAPAENTQQSVPAESQPMFLSRKTLIVSGFVPNKNIEGDHAVEGINLKLSLGMSGSPSSRDTLLVEYRLTQTDQWNQIASLTQNKDYSNEINGGYFEFSLPIYGSERKVLNDLKDIEIRLSSLSESASENAQLPIAVDAAWLTARYIGEVDIVDMKNAKNEFKGGEDPEFEFAYESQEPLIQRIINLVSGNRQAFTLEELSIKGPTGEPVDMPLGVEDGKWGKKVLKIARPDDKFRPGKYTLEFKIKEGNAIYRQNIEFYWGVLAINVNKSIYSPGETAYLQMASLDKNGNTLCDSNLLLAITDPDGARKELKVEKSDRCGPTTISETPDYFSYYDIGKTGTYSMRLDRLDDNGVSINSITDSFDVNESVSFDVERKSATRIYPIAPYVMKMVIRANEDFDGTVTDTVPKDFEIIHTNYQMSERLDGNKKVLEWKMQLVKGGVYEIVYEYNAPDISPEFYLLGPLVFTSDSSQFVFKEARSWQIASDATLSALYPDGDNTTGLPIYNSAAATSPLWSYIDNDPATGQPDADFIENDESETSGTVWLTLGTIPADFQTMDTFTYEAYLATDGSFANDTANISIRIYKSDKTTALTNAMTLGAHDAVGLQTSAFAGLDTAATKADWDAALIRLVWTYTKVTGPDNANLRLHALEFNGTYTAATLTTVSGNAYNDETTTALAICDGATNMITLRVGGVTYGPTTCNASTGAFSIANVTQPATSTPMILYIDGQASNFGSEIRRYSGSGNVTNVTVRKDRVIARSDDGAAITNTDLDTWDNDNDVDLNFVVTGGALTVESGSKLIVNTGNTLTPGGTVTTSASSASSTVAGDILIQSTATLSMGTNALSVGGDYENLGTFSKSAGQTTTFTATALGYSITPGTGNFDSVTFNGTGGGWSFSATTTIDLDLTMTAGTLSGTSNVTVNGGDVTGDGTINLTGGTFLVDGTGNFGGATAWTFNNLTFGNGTGAATTTATGTGGITVSSAMNIAANQVLDAGSKTWILSGSGTPFTISGTFTPATSTVSYNGTATTTINATTYYNLQSQPASGSPNHQLATGAVTVSNNFIVGNGTNAVTVDVNTNDPTFDVNGDFTINANGAFLASASASLTAGGNFANSGTFTHNSATTTFDAGATGKTINPGGSSFGNIVFNNASGGWSFSAATTIAGNLTMTAGTLSGTATTTVNGGNTTGDGTINLTGGTFLVDGTGNFGGATAWTFNNLTFGDGTGAATTTATGTGGITVSSAMNIAANQVLDAGSKTWILSGSGTPFTISGTFTPNTSTIRHTGTGATNIAAATYNILQLQPPSGGPTYTLPTGTINTNSDFTIGDGTNAATTTASTNNTVLNIDGNFLISANATFVASASAAGTLAGNFTNNGTFTANGGTITFDAGATGKTISGTLNGTSSFAAVTFNNASGGWTIQNNFTATGNFSFTNGALTQGANINILLTGDVITLGSASTFTKASGTGLFIMDGVSNNQTFEDQHVTKVDLGNVQIGQSPGVTKLKSDFAATSLTINTADTFETHGWEVDLATYLNCISSCIFDLRDLTPNNEGDGTIVTVGTNWTMSSTGTFTTDSAAIVRFDETGNGTLDSGGKPFNHVEIAKTSAATVTLSTSTLDIDGNFTISNTNSTLDASASNCGGGSCGIVLAKNFTNNGTFTARTGTLTFDSAATSTISGTGNPAITFYNLTSTTANKVLEFATSTTFKTDGLITITGTSGNEVKLRSNASGTQWLINHQGTENITYASVKDSGCNASSTNITLGSTNINGGNNGSCWVFGVTSFVIDSVSRNLDLNSGNNKTATTTNLLTINTTAANGYVVRAFNTQLLTHITSPSYTIPAWTGTNAAPTTWTGNCISNSQCGFGYNTNDADLTQFTNSTYYAGFTTTSPGDIVAKSTGAVTDDLVTISYKASVSNSQAAGEYQTIVRYIFTPEF